MVDTNGIERIGCLLLILLLFARLGIVSMNELSRDSHPKAVPAAYVPISETLVRPSENKSRERVSKLILSLSVAVDRVSNFQNAIHLLRFQLWYYTL